MLGHASRAMTLDRNAHLFEDELDAVADRLHEAARAPRVPPTCPEVKVPQAGRGPPRPGRPSRSGSSRANTRAGMRPCAHTGHASVSVIASATMSR